MLGQIQDPVSMDGTKRVYAPRGAVVRTSAVVPSTVVQHPSLKKSMRFFIVSAVPGIHVL